MTTLLVHLPPPLRLHDLKTAMDTIGLTLHQRKDGALMAALARSPGPRINDIEVIDHDSPTDHANP
ncbi:MAG: hypothetical protein GY788_07375 [bacterium]|nr:hypothetical protein [bacterium]